MQLIKLWNPQHVQQLLKVIVLHRISLNWMKMDKLGLFHYWCTCIASIRWAMRLLCGLFYTSWYQPLEKTLGQVQSLNGTRLVQKNKPQNVFDDLKATNDQRLGRRLVSSSLKVNQDFWTCSDRRGAQWRKSPHLPHPSMHMELPPVAAVWHWYGKTCLWFKKAIQWDWVFLLGHMGRWKWTSLMSSMGSACICSCWC